MNGEIELKKVNKMRKGQNKVKKGWGVNFDVLQEGGKNIKGEGNIVFGPIQYRTGIQNRPLTIHEPWFPKDNWN